MSTRKFNKKRSMMFPREVFAGHGVLEKVKDIVADINGPALIITGEKTYSVAGEKVKKYIEENDIKTDVIKVTEPTSENLNYLRDMAVKLKPKVILGVGGGSKIDLGKVISFEQGIKFISIPTSAAHDGISSPMASIRGEYGNTSMKTVVPYAVIADTEIIHTSPYRMLASGCADVISNITAVMDWKLAHRIHGEEMSSTAASMAELGANTILENVVSIRKNLEESVWIAIKQIIASGLSMGIAGCSRPASGAEHMFSHSLDMIYPAKKTLHGEQVGVGTIISMYLHGGNWKGIRDALIGLGAPVSAEDLGIPEEVMVEALMNAHKIRDRSTILGNGIKEEAARTALMKTYII